MKVIQSLDDLKSTQLKVNLTDLSNQVQNDLMAKSHWVNV